MPTRFDMGVNSKISIFVILNPFTIGLVRRLVAEAYIPIRECKHGLTSASTTSFFLFEFFYVLILNNTVTNLKSDTQQYTSFTATLHCFWGARIHFIGLFGMANNSVNGAVPLSRADEVSEVSSTVFSPV